MIPVLAGPTASGKSALALELAAEYPLEVVSADAMLVYRGMDIGTAKPAVAERERVPHHLIDIIEPDQAFSVASYVSLAEEAIGAILSRGNIPIVVGGTGFYIRALARGLPTAPAADEKLQAPLWKRYEREGLQGLLDDLERLSSEDAARCQRNPRRVIRALEIWQRTGRSPSSFPLTDPKFVYRKAALLPGRDALSARIARRTELMFANGLVDEVAHLLRRYPSRPTSMQAIGYKEVMAHLEERVSLVQAQQAVRLATVRYAKRQLTWFRKEPGIETLDPGLEPARTWLAGVVGGREKGASTRGRP